MSFAILEKTVPMKVSIGSIGSRRKARTGAVDVKASNGGGDPEKGSICISKELFDSPELREIQVQQSRLRRYLYAVALPSVFAEGIYLVPTAKVIEVSAVIKEKEKVIQDLVDAFLLTYPEEQEKAKKRLGVLFDSKDYPSVDRIKSCFNITTQFIDLGVPGSLESIDTQLFEAEQAKAQKMWQEAADEIRALLRSSLSDLVSHMTDRLSEGSDGKPKKFHGTLVSNFNEFLEYFEPRNVTDDVELSALVSKCRDLLKGVSPDSLRASDDIRAHVQNEMTALKVEVDKLVAEKPFRKIVLD